MDYDREYLFERYDQIKRGGLRPSIRVFIEIFHTRKLNPLTVYLALLTDQLGGSFEENCWLDGRTDKMSGLTPLIFADGPFFY